ncbi:hypothetical protein GYB59_03570 [bacterium]|nr:hypothetical protein [bacterium]
MKKTVIVTGPESSGSTFIARVIASELGIQRWNGKNWSPHGKFGRVRHFSLPNAREWPDLERWRRIPNRYFVLATRDINISQRSRKRRWGKSLEHYTEHSHRASQIMGELLQTERCFVWSYETALFLGSPYFRQLYAFLDVRSDPQGNMRDGNVKYISDPVA